MCVACVHCNGVVSGNHEVEHSGSAVTGKQVDGGDDVSEGEYEGGDEGGGDEGGDDSGDDEYETERQMMMAEKDEGPERECEEDDEYEDGSYLPSTEREGESYDDSNLDGFISDDDEFIKSKDKFKKANLRVITDDLFNGIVSNAGVTNTTDGCGESDFVDSDGDFVSDSTDEEDVRARIRERHKRRVYNPKCDHKTLKVTTGMRFVDGFQVRDALTNNAIENGWEIRFKRVCQNQVEASCKKPCKWKCYGSYSNTTGAFMLRRVEHEHTCPRNMRSKIVSANWIAKRYLNVFRLKPDTTVKELRADLVQRFAHDVSRWKLYNAKRKIIELLTGSVEEHYGKLRSYVLELMRVDKEGRFEIDVGIGSLFKGIYIGFSALRKGFMMGCRRVIGLDGAFLKTYLGGAILTAVGSDGNNQIFPIAWAVVQAENEVNWKWCLSILAEDLNLGEGVGITIISDQQKGLENAVKEFTPLAEHRNCARHVYSNLKKTHKGPTLKSLFWQVVRSTYVEEYRASCNEFEKELPEAFALLMTKNITRFCKAFITPVQKSDSILNNVCESFNAYTVDARAKHVIHMLEDIRSSLMERSYRKLHDVRDNDDALCPMIRKKVEDLMYKSRYCITIPALGGQFEVTYEENRFVVTPALRSCGCRVWDITGIPCIHVCSVITFMNEKVESYVNEYYTLEKYKMAHSFGIPPLNGENMWPEAEGYKVTPPPAKKMPGRPKKLRKRDLLEKDPSRPNKLRKICVMTCQRCLQQGPNTRSCKNDPVAKPTNEKGKPGRPRKVLSVNPQPQAHQRPRRQQAPSGSGAQSGLATQESRV